MQTLRLAQQLGAETVTLSGQNIADEIVAYARSRNVSKIVIGKPEQPHWRERFTGSLVDHVIRKSGQIDVYVIRGEATETLPQEPRPPGSASDYQGYIWAGVAVALCTAIAWCMFAGRFVQSDLSNLVMIYLLGVVVVATRIRQRSGYCHISFGRAGLRFLFC